MSLPFHQVHKPSEHTHQQSSRPHFSGDPRVRVGAFRERLHIEHCGEQAFLRSTTSSALDFWAGAGVFVLHNHGANALQFGLCA